MFLESAHHNKCLKSVNIGHYDVKQNEIGSIVLYVFEK